MWEVIIEAIVIWAIGYLPAAVIVKRSYLKRKAAGRRYYAHLTMKQINEDALQLSFIWPILLMGVAIVLLYGLCVELVRRVK